MNKIDKIGIRGQTNNYFRDYFKDRKQIVKIDNTYSDECEIKCGVLQGSVLGPLFFLMYINDMIDLFCDRVIAFVDDTTVLCEGENWTEVEKIANYKINIIDNWLRAHKLILNNEKTVFITFSIYNNKQPDKILIKIKQQTLSNVKTAKSLGIYIDSNLRWNAHVNNITKKSYYIIFILKKLVNILSFHQVLAAYYALLQSVISYGIIGWGGVYKSHRDKLDRIHKNIVKVIYNKFKCNKIYLPKLKDIMTLDGLYYNVSIKMNIKFLIKEYQELDGKRI